MEHRVLFQSDEPGGLNDLDDIKILVCYLLHAVGKPLSLAQINYICQFHSLVNYFSLCQAIKELQDTRHLTEQIDATSGETLLSLTDLGAETATALHQLLPRTARDKVASVGHDVAEKAEKQRNIKTSIHKTSDGYQVTFNILDIGTDLMELKLFAPDRTSAEQMVENFINRSIVIYQELLDKVLPGSLR